MGGSEAAVPQAWGLRSTLAHDRGGCDQLFEQRHRDRARDRVGVERRGLGILQEQGRVQARQVDLPEVVVQILPTCEYPGGGMAAHLFGYVGEIQQNQLQRPEFNGLEIGTMVGQAGLERTYNSLLQGKDGKR